MLGSGKTFREPVKKFRRPGPSNLGVELPPMGRPSSTGKFDGLCVFVLPLFKASQPEVADVADFPDADQLRASSIEAVPHVARQTFRRRA
jgi:hypothetical protein